MAMLAKCQSFIDASQTGLGASRSAAAAGYDPGKTPLELWGEIKGKAKKRRTDTTCLHGHIVEPGMKLFLLNALEPHGYTDKPLKTYPDDSHEPERIVCKKYPFLYFHPDAIFQRFKTKKLDDKSDLLMKEREEIVIEFKTALWTEHWNQEAGINYLKFDFAKFEAMAYAKEIDLPKKHYWQVQHQLVCNGSSEAILFAEVGFANNYIIYKIKLDENIDMHIAKLADFWFYNVKQNVMPDDTHPDDIKRLRDWGKVEENISIADEEQNIKINKWVDLKDEVKEKTKELEVLSNQIKKWINTKNSNILSLIRQHMRL